MAESIVDAKTVSDRIVVDATERAAIRVLQVDDDVTFLKVAKQCLEIEDGFQVDTALSVEEAMEKMKERTYDAVVSDYVMPGKDGLDFLKELRGTGSNIPFVMFTGRGREEIAVKALNLGANGYFSKIGSPETVYSELAHGIGQIVERQRAEETLKTDESYLRTVLDSTFAGLIVIDEKTHKIVDVNFHALEMMDRSREHVIGKVCHRFICPAQKGKCPITEGRTIDRSEHVLLRADGGEVPILKTVTPIMWRGRKYLTESFVDITERKKAEQAIQESEEYFKRLFLNNPEAAVYTDSSFRILDINPRFCELFGYSSREVKGKHIDDVIVPSDKMDEAKMLREDFMKGLVYCDTVRKRKDGSLVPVSISVAPITIENRSIGHVALYRDITERKRYEERLSALNIYSRDLNMAGSMEEIYCLTLDAMQKVLGFEYADFMVVDKSMLYIADTRGYPEPFRLKLPLDGTKHGITVNVVKTGNSVIAQDVRKNIDFVEGLPGIVSELAVPIKVGQKTFGVLNVESKKLHAFDEKDQELLETLASHAATAMSNLEYAKSLETYAREMQESQQRFQRLFMDNPEATAFLDSDLRILDINPRFSELFGYSLDEIKDRYIDDIVVPKDRLEEGKKLGIEFMKGYAHHDTVRKRKDGSLVPVSISGGPITVGGKTTGALVLYRDITEREHYEASLSALNIHGQKLNAAESMEEIYRLTMDAVQKTLGFAIAFLMVVDKDKLRIVDHRGYPSSFTVELPLDGTKRGIAVKVVRTGKTINVRDAERKHDWVEFMPGIRSGLDVPIKIGRRVVGVIGVNSKEIGAFDEKDQKLVEILASHTAAAMSNLDRAKRLQIYAREIQESQHRFERLFMDNPEAAVHLDSSFHILNINPRFMRLFGYSIDEIRGKHINDVIVPKDKMKEAVAFDERASRGELYHEDTVRKRKDGSLAPVAFSVAPMTAEDQVTGHIAVYKDISQLKKAEEELRQTMEKLAKTNEKLRVVGGLTRHDVRNKLSAITGNIYLARKKLTGKDEVLVNLKEMELVIAQVVRIFDFARTYEMIGVEELRRIDVEKEVGEAVSLFSDLKGVRVVNKCRGLTVLADSMLRQLFYNLIDNSLKYGEKIKTVTIGYEEIDKDELRLVYEDDGVGIAETEKKKLFQEGYGRGTGYGLYLIRKMCEGYGWSIQETGKQSEGAQFTITIPRIGRKKETDYSLS
jgi:PAS domain S-box-containing protein